MSFKLKSAAVAVAFAAIAGQASAASSPDALLYVFDQANGSSFVMDLGLASLFAPTNTGSQSFSVAGVDWTSFTTQATYAADLAAGNVLWGLLSSPGITTFTSTVALGVTPTALPSYSNIGAISLNVGGGVYASMGGATTNFAGAGTTGSNNWNVVSGTNLAANTSFATGNVVGASGVALDVFSNSGARGAATTMAPFLQTASFNGTNLTVAAVPEPGTYAMMIAGLLMVGAIARRRNV